jgi:gentisate 1,2-dioxygenase
MDDKLNSATHERDAYYARIAPSHLAPLWTRLKSLVPKEPVPEAQAHRWAYDQVRPYVMEAASLITAEEAERRVLILENPALKGSSRIAGPLYAGLQLIMPGEVAPAHRHTQSALRFVLEGKGAYTAVEGEPTYMSPGDFVVTPSWTWHHHGNESDGPMVWLDGLDIPLVTYFGGTFREDHHEAKAAIARPAGDSLARYGMGLLPIDYKPATQNSPIFNYPYARTREALHILAQGSDPDPHQGHLMRYVNPATGSWAMPTLAAMIRLLPRGFSGRPYRATDNAVFVGVEGDATLTVGNEKFPLHPRDVVVVPGWLPYTLAANEDAVLFTFSDRVAQEKLGLFREARESRV